jgi:YbbR domain-containing protein
MVLKINYDKNNGTLTTTTDEESVSIEINQQELIDTASELSFEIAVDLSQYQEFFNDEIIDDGDNNE